MNYYSEKDIRDIVAKVVNSSLGAAAAAESMPKAADSKEGILVEVSARHVHLTVEDVEKLFGKGYRLTPKKMLSQPGEFLSNERVKLVTDKGFMQNVAVLGPERKRTQVELSATDAKTLGVKIPVRLSGDLDGSGDMLIIGREGCIKAKECAIIAQAHIHMTTEDAQVYQVKDGQRMSVQLASDRSVVLENVIARVKDKSKAFLAMHIDFDEANAACVNDGTKAFIVKRW